MCVSIDHDIGIIALRQLFGRGASDFVPVTHMDAHAVNRQKDLWRETWLPWRIRVAEHGTDGRDHAKLLENIGSTHVTRVENELDPVECLMNPNSKEAVRIGNESQYVRVGVWHDHFYILGLSCHGYDWHCD